MNSCPVENFARNSPLLLSCLVSDELRRRGDRLLERRRKQAGFRDPQRTLDNFDFTFIGQGYRVIYREAHLLLEEIAEAALDGNRKEHMELLATVPLLIIDDLGMRKLGPTAGEDLLEIVMRRYERASTLLTSNRPVEDWGKLLGDSAAVTAMLDRLLDHGHILKYGPRSWRTKTDLPDEEKAG
jgi:IstB-like ATP binding protein